MSIEIAEVKEEVFDLKHGQAARLEGIVVRMENDLNPKVKPFFDAGKVRHDDTTELKPVCREQDKKLGDHKLRIPRLEK